MSTQAAEKPTRESSSIRIGKLATFIGPVYSATSSCFVDSADCNGGEDFVVKNDRGAKFLAIDAFKLEYNAPPI